MAGSEKGKTLLLTGGTGFIGRFLVPALLADGWSVVVLSRQAPEAVAALLGSSVKSISHLEQWVSDKGPDACINLAGEGVLDRRWSAQRKQLLRRSRIDLTRDLVSWLNHFSSPAKVFLSGSAVGFYGVERGSEPLSESVPAGDDFAAQLCKGWEGEARKINNETRLCLLRTGVVLHSQNGALARMLPPFRLGLGGMVGSGKQVMPWIHIEDMVRGIVYLLNSDARGPFNFVAPQSLSNREFTRTLGSVLHRPVVFTMPAPVLRFLLGEGAVLLLEGQNPVPAGLEKANFCFNHPELDSALTNLLS
ncbi:TIGR01777 family oxidoreductase [Parendozoicomonas sp. Alg238-R29]|uniref:TIGR01777 family oxidoreductase n=1 Tax=Parendozoicomonas sp. Alg238-R29 TaxID=2993446 RepID=UPI00248D58CA|nr:TIGR01777 family oxidoreductase [Parendozoicomonas sp. Alg238-R29]